MTTVVTPTYHIVWHRSGAGGRGGLPQLLWKSTSQPPPTCGNTYETRYWVYCSCDEKGTKHDFDTAAYGVNRAEGHRWVFAAAERLAVPHSRPAAAAAVTAAPP